MRKMKKIDAIELAKYVVWYFNDTGRTITHLKLQKLLYYLQGECLNRFDHVLFENEIEAWSYGPVVRDVYFEYCSNGALPLRSKDEDGEVCSSLTDEIQEMIKDVLKLLLDCTARSLVTKTHRESPWRIHADEVENGEKPVITETELRNFFCTAN